MSFSIVMRRIADCLVATLIPMQLSVFQEGVIVKNLNVLKALGLVVVLATTRTASAQTGDVSANCSPSCPAFLTSMSADAEPSLFESTIVQNNVELEDRVQRLESQLNQVQRYAYSNPRGTLEQQLQQQDSGSGKLYGAIEITFLKPSLSGAEPTRGLGISRMIDSDYTTGIRYVLGYSGDSGLGVRGRYWSFSDNYDFVPPFAPSQLGIAMKVADAEVTLAQRLRHFYIEASGGLRYGRLQYSNGTPSLFGVGQLTFEGIGPTASLGARKTLGNSGISLFGNVRGSVMFGDVRNASLLTFMPAGTIKDEIMTVAENQMGIAWTRNLSPVWQLEVRTAWETQYWMSSTISDDTYGIGSNLALAGPTIAVELRY